MHLPPCRGHRPDVKNDVLSKYVVATGSDGYRAVVSLGELNPRYGGEDTPQIIAYPDVVSALWICGSPGTWSAP